VGGAFSQGGKKFAAQIYLLLNSSYMYIEKRCSYEKFVRKMLMKLTPACSYRRILCVRICDFFVDMIYDKKLLVKCW